MNNIYVQNQCRNYCTKETSSNKNWVNIARNYWSGFLAQELDSMLYDAFIKFGYWDETDDDPGFDIEELYEEALKITRLAKLE